VLQFITAPDYETDAHTYAVQVTANDGVNNSVVQNLTVSVGDVNDNKPVITSTATPGTVLENTKDVVTLTSTDVDTVGGPVTYSVTGGADAAKFTVVNGVLQFVTAPDYETQAHSYTVQVTANDGANNSVAQTLTVSVGDVNDNKPVITSSATPGPVLENTKAVVTLASTDVDTVGGPVTYSITGGADAAKFEIVNGVLQFITAPDYETDAHTYAVQVTANDGANNSVVQNLTVSVTDVNDNKPVFALAGLQVAGGTPYNVDVNENVATTLSVLNAAATDADGTAANAPSPTRLKAPMPTSSTSRSTGAGDVQGFAPTSKPSTTPLATTSTSSPSRPRTA
jgi:hypothetical protein